MNQTFLHVRNMELGIFRPVLVCGQHPSIWIYALKATLELHYTTDYRHHAIYLMQINSMVWNYSSVK